jgi:RNA polymerase sigma-70 factor (ECF subfamily)
MDDDELIASLAGGDETALRELFARHAPWLAARLRKALPPDDVEDVLQETFFHTARNVSCSTSSTSSGGRALRSLAASHGARPRPGSG